MHSNVDTGLGTGRDAFTRGRKFRAAELHLMVLTFLNDEPRHGYELIKAFGSLSQGFYSPSPGVLYPVLGEIVQQGHAMARSEGKRKCYMISDQGRRYLDENGKYADQLFARLRHAARKMTWMQSLGPEAATQATGWLPEFVEAREAFKAALFARNDADFTEQRRLTAILRSAIATIEQGSCPPGCATDASAAQPVNRIPDPHTDHLDK
nr:PadR family transcriptional regulator [Pseudomonas sp.]